MMAAPRPSLATAVATAVLRVAGHPGIASPQLFPLYGGDGDGDESMVSKKPYDG